MTAKNKELIENWLLMGEAKRLRDAGFITSEDVVEIRGRIQLPKSSSNFMIRIGFFLLGCSLYSSILGAVSLFFIDSWSVYQYLLLLFALIGLVIAEVLSNVNYHNYGLDDAFILSFQIIFFGAVGMIVQSPVAVFFMMIVLGFASCVRYFSTMSMFFCLAGISSFAIALITELKLLPATTLPFLMAAVSILLYFAYHKIKEDRRVRLYRNSVRLVKNFSLIVGYLSMNYFVVREASEDLMGWNPQNGDIPLAWVFYLTTFIIPVCYISYGIMKRDRSFLIVGLLSLAFSIFSIRYYYYILPPEWALIFGGTALFLLSFYVMNKIRHRETGITFRADKFSDSEAFAYAQAAIVNSHVQPNPDGPADSPMEFGGGDFSGGGASGKY